MKIEKAWTNAVLLISGVGKLGKHEGMFYQLFTALKINDWVCSLNYQIVHLTDYIYCHEMQILAISAVSDQAITSVKLYTCYHL